MISVQELHYIDIGTHGANAIYILINLCITAMPVRIQHFWHCLVMFVLYMIFSIIYEVSGGTNAQDKGYIYSVLDWDNVETTIVYAIITGFVVPIVIWLVLCGLYWIRIAIFKGCKCTNNYDSDLRTNTFIMMHSVENGKYSAD